MSNAPPGNVPRVKVSPASFAIALWLRVGPKPSATMPAWLLRAIEGSVPESIEGVDAAALTLWAVHGLVLFGEGAPSMKAAKDSARSTMAALAMHRHEGNVTRAAHSLRTSRRALREALRRGGLYPWRVAAVTRDDTNGRSFEEISELDRCE